MMIAFAASAPLSAVTDSGDVTKTGATSTLTSTACTATPVGGTAPFTHLWTKVSGDAITISTNNVDNTTFVATGMASPETRVALFKDTVTDNLGVAVATRNITVTINRA